MSMTKVIGTPTLVEASAEPSVANERTQKQLALLRDKEMFIFFLVTEHWDKSKSIRTIEKEMGRSRGSLWYWIRKYGIKVRDQSGSVSESNKQRAGEKRARRSKVELVVGDVAEQKGPGLGNGAST